MVQTMEAWLLADLGAVHDYFQTERTDLHSEPMEVESFTKKDLTKKLNAISVKGKSKNGAYSKRRDSYKILEILDPNQLTRASVWAKRFFEHLKSLEPHTQLPMKMEKT